MNHVKIIISFLLIFLILLCSEKEANNDKMQAENEYSYIYVGDEKNPYTGKIVAKYKNGNKKWEVNYENGIKNGIQTDWYPNGEKMMEGLYKNGMKDGIWIMWDENGNKIENEYKAGKEM